MKRIKGKMNKIRDKDHYSLPIGIIPEWLLKAEAGKGFWENFIPDEKLRNHILAKIKERSQWNKGDLFYEKAL